MPDQHVPVANMAVLIKRTMKSQCPSQYIFVRDRRKRENLNRICLKTVTKRSDVFVGRGLDVYLRFDVGKGWIGCPRAEAQPVPPCRQHPLVGFLEFPAIAALDLPEDNVRYVQVYSSCRSLGQDDPTGSSVQHPVANDHI